MAMKTHVARAVSLGTTSRAGRLCAVRVTRVRRTPTRALASLGTGLPPAITLTPMATKQLIKLRNEDQDRKDLCLRVGVRQGGCSGMSYTMDLEERTKISDSDSVIDDESNGFTIVCDPKSLLYLFGLQLDYSDALIGGGFQFQNPNSCVPQRQEEGVEGGKAVRLTRGGVLTGGRRTDTCGCGKSFSA